MTAALLLTLSLGLGAPAGPEGPAYHQPVNGADQVTVTRLTSPEKALRFEVIVPAALDAVWDAFSTDAGLATWLWRDVRVELRPGGDWLCLFPGGKTAGGTILSIDPKKRLTIAALAPEQYPAVRDQRTRAIFAFETAGPGQTRVTLEQTGWRTGPEWDAAYDYLAKGNAALLTQLYQRFVSGPANWNKQ